MSRRAESLLGECIALLGVVLFLLVLFHPAPASAQEKKAPPKRTVRFEWNASKTMVFVSVSFRDVVDARIQKELRRGLPTTIVLTGTIYSAGVKKPLSTTAQTCKITWQVWEEAYRIEVIRPGRSRAEWTTTVEGVLRRCAEVRRLLAGNSSQVPFGAALYMHAKVQVDPVSKDMLQKIKRWVSRPTGTATAAPGDALFSTFTGLFLQRIGDAERELKLTTRTVLPTVIKPKKKKRSDRK